uniref:Uncharacterized protein n=1 Tax=Rhizophagus irregularis (strain DAOM 181602 / DAOM 197198 / MUCL 43194) TaxID=747089 RepID=U9TQ91_RHIID
MSIIIESPINNSVKKKPSQPPQEMKKKFLVLICLSFLERKFSGYALLWCYCGVYTPFITKIII